MHSLQAEDFEDALVLISVLFSEEQARSAELYRAARLHQPSPGARHWLRAAVRKVTRTPSLSNHERLALELWAADAYAERLWALTDSRTEWSHPQQPSPRGTQPQEQGDRTNACET
ncbi:MAG: hypothetical protein AAGD10_08260 [Myxococcota bacterium]